MARGPASSETDQKGLNRGTWTVEEDRLLVEYVRRHGQGRWRKLAEHTGLRRSGKSCRLRWLNYLRPELKKGNITPEEEDLIIRLHKLLGNRWSLIAGRLPGRSDNEIKNYWNTNLRKKATSSSCLHEESNSAYENENLTTINHVSSRPSCYSSSSPPPSDNNNNNNNNNNNTETVATINVFRTDNIDTITSSSELYKYVDLDGDGHEDAIHRIGWEGLLPIHNSCGTMINDCGGTPSGDHENFLGKILMDLDLVSASEFWHAINDWIGGYCKNA